jgi:outer membrane receptor protein involved in Fe transport
LHLSGARGQEFATVYQGIVADPVCVGDLTHCDCPGCRAYRARLEQGFFVSDLGAELPSFEDVVLTQAAEPIQPRDVSASLGGSTSLAGFGGSPAASLSIFNQIVGFANADQPINPNTPSVQTAQTAPGGAIVSAKTAGLLASPETGSILRDAGPSNSVSVQRRNTVAYDPHVRGFRYGQVLNRVGGVWTPVRQDLDSPISKLDPSLIEDIAVIPGPYTSQYGPAFAFIDVVTAATPRYENGYESHIRLGETYHENRGRQHGRTTVFGGGADWGFIGHYGSRTGSDYRSGNNTLIPSSYNNQSFLGQLGFDLSPSSKLEVRYDRLDQNDTEYALQFFDINYLGSDSAGLHYVDVDPGGPFSRVDFDAWYNRTRYNGNNYNVSKEPVVDRVRAALTFDIPGSQYQNVGFKASTFGNRMLTGGRLMGSIGDQDYAFTRVGADYRFEDQFIRENYLITESATNSQQRFYTNLPKCWLDDVGVFQELVLPFDDYWTTTLGVRADVVNTNVRTGDLRPGGNISPSQVKQSDTLYSFYCINDVVLTENWISRFGFGHGQRVPMLTERYSDGVFLGIIQSGFSRVIGDPNLDKERLWQVDWGLSANYDRFRGRGALYQSWILDFATYSANIISSPDGARLLTSTNTGLATFAGFELYGEADVDQYLTLFSAMNYVQGTDQSIDVPMWGVAPLGGRAGLRIHDGDGGQTWGCEFGIRMVDNQDRIGFLRNTGDPTVLIPIEQPTAGFSTVDLRNYYNVTKNTSLILGVENLFDKNYLEHLDLRLPAQLAPPVPPNPDQGIPNLPAVAALSPGITFYTGIEITR